MKKFKKTFEIPYYDCNKDGHVRPISLLKYLGETSMLHSDHEGMGAKELEEMNCAWILNRWRVSFDTYPRAKESISIETWPSNFYKFYANREFKIYDQRDKLIGKASSLWVLIDTKRERPIRISDKVYDSSLIIDERSFDSFYSFDKEFDLDREMDFRVRKSDIDYNNHVNNTKYLEWLVEVVSDDIDKNYKLSEFEIFYKKEIRYGNYITSQISKETQGEESLVYNHKIIDKDSGDLKTLGKTIWRK